MSTGGGSVEIPVSSGRSVETAVSTGGSVDRQL